MRLSPLWACACSLLAFEACAASGTGPTSEISRIREEMQRMRAEYEQRMNALEERLRRAEQAAAEARQRATRAEEASVAPTAAAPAAAEAPNRFNPSIGLILNGRLAAFSRPAEENGIPGFSIGEEATKGPDGFSLGESELSVEAAIDDRFYGRFTLAVESGDHGDEVGVEEGFVQTTALGHGLTLLGGRYYPGIGYLNDRHTHTDAFADRPLPYRAFLDTQYNDDGAGLRWVAPTDLLVEVGADYLRGAHYPAGGAADSGKGAYAVYAHAGGDVGVSHSWRAGVGYLHAEARDRADSEDDLFSGATDLWIADAVWKWAPNGNPYRHNLTLQGEFLWQRADGAFTPRGKHGVPYRADAWGLYGQAVYQFLPGWRLGGRIAWLHAADPGPALVGSVLDAGGRDPRQYSVMIDWSHSEFSRLRLQYNRDESRRRPDDQILLQYTMSLGAHGAHTF